MGRRNLIVVLGDQLNRDASAMDGFDPASDMVWMAEVDSESKHVWTHKMRIALFLSAMRHFRAELERDAIRVDYRKLDEPRNGHSLALELERAIQRLKPTRVVCTEPGEHRVRVELEQACAEAGVTLEVRPDRHFLCSVEKFSKWADGRKELRMEFFYRVMRADYNILMEGRQPVGGQWNFDAENRGSFGKAGPRNVPAPVTFKPDAITCEVLQLVNQRFASHPGSCDSFDYPVTREQALAALADFIAHRLPEFGLFQDAMWTGEELLFHSRLSAALNLKLLDPREMIRAAVHAFEGGRANLAATEGFVRQILGWREYVRGVYWMLMPGYSERNGLEACEKLPGFYWTGETDMRCLAEAIGQTLRTGYAHHIQRLMVTGLFALLYGVDPKEVHQWYLAVYVDAVEWVELPNTLGMSQYADGGVMASKPYCASGKYIQRMSNYCSNCKYDPAESTGSKACPFTTLYWDFLLRHEERLARNQRLKMQLRNLDRLSAAQKSAIQVQAAQVRARLQ